MDKDRVVILLKAVVEIAEKLESSHYVLNFLEETANYDDCDCDGYCLVEDIKIELGLDDD
jgi:hypothetical protein